MNFHPSELPLGASDCCSVKLWVGTRVGRKLLALVLNVDETRIGWKPKRTREPSGRFRSARLTYPRPLPEVDALRPARLFPKCRESTLCRLTSSN